MGDSMNPYPFKPILNRIVVRPDPEITQVGAIIVPEVAKVQECDGNKYLTGEFVVSSGTVLAVGPGLRHKKGHILPVQLKPGDRVEYRRVGDGAAGLPLNIEGENVLLMREDDVIALHAPQS